MSFEVVKMVFEHTKTRGVSRLILLAIASFVNDKAYKATGKAESFPSVAKIAVRAGVSQRCVKDHLPKLRESGEITWENHGRSNHYNINIPLDSDYGVVRT